MTQDLRPKTHPPFDSFGLEAVLAPALRAAARRHPPSGGPPPGGCLGNRCFQTATASEKAQNNTKGDSEAESWNVTNSCLCLDCCQLLLLRQEKLFHLRLMATEFRHFRDVALGFFFAPFEFDVRVSGPWKTQPSRATQNTETQASARRTAPAGQKDYLPTIASDSEPVWEITCCNHYGHRSTCPFLQKCSGSDVSQVPFRTVTPQASDAPADPVQNSRLDEMLALESAPALNLSASASPGPVRTRRTTRSCQDDCFFNHQTGEHRPADDPLPHPGVVSCSDPL